MPQLAVLGGLLALWSALVDENFVLFATGSYVLLSVGLRFLIARDHRRGVRLLHQERLADAIPHFEASYRFFSRHPWIDDWRYLTLLSSSRISYREMALLNKAYCHGQSGHGQTARELYEQTLREFPGSKMAEAALRVLDATRSVT